MTSTFFGLETALRSLRANQEALDTTGHNIANASTPGYSRQQAVLTATLPLTLPAGGHDGVPLSLGSGVEVSSVQRIRDQFLDLQYRAQNTLHGYSSQMATSLGEAQTAMAEPSDDGLAARMQTFWNAWSDLSNDPTSTAARQALIDAGTDLAEGISTLDGRLQTVADQAADQYTSLMDADGPVKADADELAELNDAIADATQRGDAANDLMDRRDQLIDQLSGYAYVKVVPSTTRAGAVTVYFGDTSATPTALVDGDVRGAAAVVTWPPTLSADPQGELGALKDLSSTTSGPIADLRTQLNAIAKSLVDAVNDAYTAGGTVTGSFFSATAGSEAATIAVDPSVTVASLHTGTGAAGSNDIALAVSALRDQSGGADDLYAAFASHVGSYVQNAQRDETLSQSLTDSIDANRQSVSGVSLDEEMTNLIKFQRAYQASARMLTTLDSVLDQLINRTGVVGL
ncbi:MAG TPA: flagellar hook-associated protein FlgK [Solirubrobacteraceae bacterium]|jgi:flagellar hook-associated protein 1 FlgK|nr:flagellar hook-associated protein FlgK [Solirubrobacteraceae bacterium]